MNLVLDKFSLSCFLHITVGNWKFWSGKLGERLELNM